MLRLVTRFMRMAMPVCFVFAVAVVMGACAGNARSTCAEGTEHFVKYELFMGLDSQSGEVVADEAWNTFLEDSVTPRFPDGLTVFDARGQWRNPEGLVLKERSKVLVILVPPGEDGMRLTGEIADEYKLRFNQESVLSVVSDVCATFS